MIFSLKGKAQQYKTSESVKAHTQEIMHNIDTIKTVDLSNNIFFGDAINCLFNAIKEIKHLEVLILSNIFSILNKEQVVYILKIICESVNPHNLKHFDISHNAISCEFPECFIAFIGNLNNLESLVISNCGLGADGGTLLASTLSTLKNKRNLKNINISDNKLTSAGKALGTMINKFTNIKEVYIAFNTMDSASMLDFLHSIDDTNLSVLDIRDNRVDEKGCKLLGEYLYNMDIKKLMMGDCVIGDEGLKELFDSYYKAKMYSMFVKWTKNKKYIDFDISYNDLTDEVMKDLCFFVSEVGIERLQVIGNDFEDFSALTNILDKNGGELLIDEDDDDEESELIHAFNTKLNKL